MRKKLIISGISAFFLLFAIFLAVPTFAAGIIQTINLIPGQQAKIFCAGRLLTSAGINGKKEGTVFCKNLVTPKPSSISTPTPSPVATDSPQGGMGTPVPNGSAPGGGFGAGGGDGLEIGINLTKFNDLRTRAATGEFDRECTSAEHDAIKWHSLINEEAKCHYNHHHGDDPNYVNDACAVRKDGTKVCFGEPGSWFDKPGQSVSYPWQTFKFPGNAINQYITPEEAGALNGGMENQAKHEGYTWIVRRNQTCPAGEICTTDFRIQFHSMMFTHDAVVRYHSTSIEARICKDASDPKTCGIARYGGWGDFGILMTPQYNGSYNCSGVGSSRFGDPSIETFLDAENLFFPIYPEGHPDRHRNYPPGVDERFRCHNVLTPAQVQNHISNGEDVILDQWWMRDPTRLQIRFFDPIGNAVENPAGSQQFATHFYCEMDMATGKAKDPNCRMNQSKYTAAMEYVFGVPEAVIYDWSLGTTDSNGDGFTDVTREKNIYATRWHQSTSQSKKCTSPGLDCIPYVLDNIELNSFGNKEGAYNHHQCSGPTCPVLDHDLTPLGRPSWINWFYRFAQH